MKIQQPSLLIMLFITQLNMGMELTSPQFLTKDILLYVTALAQNHATMHMVSKQCAYYITQENILQSYPKSLTRRNHIQFMVKTAKKYDTNESLIRLGIQTASLCKHDYAMILSLFMPDNFPLIATITAYKKRPNEEHFKTLLPSIISVYSGDQTAIDEYKNKPRTQLPLEYNNRVTALHIAVNRQDHISVAELLLAQNPDLLNQRPLPPANSDKDSSQFIMATPLEIAISHSDIVMCTFLLSFKNIDIPTSSPHNKNTSFLNWIFQESNLKCIKLITNTLKQKYDKKAYICLLNHVPLENIVHKKNKALFLLKEIEYDLPGATKPLHIVVKGNHYDLVEALCNHPTININAQNENLETPLFIAVDNGRFKIIDILLRAKANPNIPDIKGRTPLMRATYYCHNQVVESLLQYNAHY